MWRDYYKMDYAIENGVFYSRLFNEDGTHFYNLPLSNDIIKSVKELIKQDSESVIRFCTVPEDYLDFFTQNYKVKITPQEEHFDYLYLAEDFKTFAGKKFGGQRNLVHQFLRLYPDNRYEKITEKNLSEVIKFFKDNYLYSVHELSLSEHEENQKTLEVLNNLELYGFFGGALYANGKIVAFSLGEKIGDVIHIHIEKADKTVKGAYQTVVTRFANAFCDEKVKFINREEDMGDLGLRESKRSYHPIDLLKKFNVEVYK